MWLAVKDCSHKEKNKPKQENIKKKTNLTAFIDPLDRLLLVFPFVEASTLHCEELADEMYHG